jgi:hypothetical protein
MTPTQAPEAERRTSWEVVRYWTRRAVMMEIWGYLSIFRFVFRRPKVPRGAQAFTYHQLVLPLLSVFIVVSAIELVVVDVLVRRWEGVRIAMLVLGIWGLVWMFGLLFGFLTRPHAVGAEGIRLRSGAELDIPLRWDQIAAVSRRKRTAPDKQPQISVDEHGDRTLHLHMQNQTNVRIALHSPATVRLPRGPQTVSTVEVWVDQPDAFTDAARGHLTGPH